jgi:F-type H+-transporting ATPase subunit gamma
VDHFKKSAVARRITRPQFFSKFDFSVAESLGQEALAVFTEEKITELVVIHGTFKSMVKQEVAQTRLLPVTPAGPVAAAGLCSNALLEPADETEMLKTLLPLHVKAKFYGMLRDTFTAFLASQMRAMDNATRNAGDLISSITLEMNKVRQAVITREIAEIISTSEVVK